MSTMIRGIGVDVVDLDRIRGKDARFVNRVLSEEERKLYDAIQNPARRVSFLAGRFAAKEAYTKAWGTFETPLNFCDVSIMPDASGKPVLQSPDDHGVIVHLSITHSDTVAIGFVIIEKDVD